MRQFAAARACARSCLEALGAPAGPLLRTPSGAPAWPAGLIGSITHCDGYRGAVAAPGTTVEALGIDAEPALPLPHGVLGLVASPAERRSLTQLAAHSPGVPWDRLLFSAKEAVYKAWHPVSGRWIGCADVEVRLAPAPSPSGPAADDDLVTGALRARVRTAASNEAGARYSGRWAAGSGLLLTAVTGH